MKRLLNSSNDSPRKVKTLLIAHPKSNNKCPQGLMETTNRSEQQRCLQNSVNNSDVNEPDVIIQVSCPVNLYWVLNNILTFSP